MRILLASSEAVPFAKTGGLADVATGLSKALVEAGHDVTLILPMHRRFIPDALTGEIVGLITVPLHRTEIRATVRRLVFERVEVLLVDQPSYFDRPALYTEGGHDYPDNAERFLFFSRAIVEIAQTLARPHILHVNDWQTALVPALIRHERERRRRFTAVGSVLTIHNMAFHGQFPAWHMEQTGLPDEYFNWRQLEYYGSLNLLKGGIALADMVTTVSPTYAREICRPEFGYGLDPLLLEREDTLVGILNGVDADEWNPATDPHLAENFDADTVAVGKPACKAALQAEVGLHVRPEPCLMGMISRLTEQKGVDLVLAQADAILQADVQMLFLGTGDPAHQQALLELQRRHPGRVAVRIGFDEALAHRIEAGLDIFLMPSRFEPCGLNQQYSLLYGAPPIVHAVGGLADSVVDATDHAIIAGTATGFQFFSPDPDAFLNTVWRAVGVFQHRPDDWSKMQQNGMRRDCSWRHSAAEYVRVYERALEAARPR